MTTVINTPGTTTGSSDSGSGVLVAVVVLIIIVVLFLIFGLPYLRGGAGRATTGTQSGTQINVPDKLNVDVNTNK